MKSYAALLRLFLRNLWTSFLSSMAGQGEKKIRPGYIVLMGIGMIGLAMLAGMIVVGEVLLSKALGAIGQKALLPALAMLLCFVCTLMMGFIGTLARLYFNKDAAWLASLPVSSRTVMAARLTPIYLGELLLNAVFLLPAFIMLGLQTGGGVLFWIRAAVTILMSSAIPMALIVLISAALARCASLLRHKDFIITLGSLLMVGFVIWLEMSVLPRIPDDADAMFFVRLLLSNTALVELLTSALPPVRWAVQGLMGDWASLGLYVLVSLTAIALPLLLLGRSYLDVCIRQTEQSAKRKKRKLESGSLRASSPLKALFVREWKELLRTPAYALNGLTGIIFVPLMMAFILLGISSEIPHEQLTELLPMVRGIIREIPVTDLMLLLAGVMALTGLMNPATATAVTREGRHHDLYRIMPVRPIQQLNSKLAMGMSINSLGMLLLCGMMAFLLGELSWLLLPALLIASMLNYAISALSLSIDALFPNYAWANETQAIKQSMNVLWSMLLSLVAIGIPVVLWVVLFNRGMAAGVRFAAVLALLAVEAAVAVAMLYGPGLRSYTRSEG